MAATILCTCSSTAIFRLHSVLFLPARKRIIKPNLATVGVKRSGHNCQTRNLSRRFFLFAANQGSTNSSESNESVPSWARPDSDEPPPWARDEGKDKSLKQSFEAPFYVYLLASAITAIAAIGSVFEYVNQRPVFGILNADSIFYTPLLGFFAFTGIPTSAFLWFKSVQAANKEAEEQDRRDGYL